MRPRLTDMIDMRHELVKLAALIDWEFFETEWAGFCPSHTGRPATSPRLVAGRLYLQHTYRLSDEAVVARWVENPYYQHFCGETFFQLHSPLDPSSLTRWRKRIGERAIVRHWFKNNGERVEWLLTKTIEAGLSLRQSYARLAPRLSGQIGRYAHARQFKRMRKALRRLKGYTGHVMRDILRQLGGIADAALKQRIEAEIALVDRLLRHKPKDKGKLGVTP